MILNGQTPSAAPVLTLFDLSPATFTGKEHILFVDDDHTIVKIGEEILKTKGYRVTSATGSMDALSIFQLDPQQFDLVITDMTMPDMTGDHLAMNMLSLRPDIPVIICSGGDVVIHEEELHARGIKAIVMKPFTIATICRTIRQVMDGQV